MLALPIILAQIIATFSPQPPSPHTLPGLTEWSVWVCSAHPEARTISGGLVYSSASDRMRPITPAGVMRIAVGQRKRSPVTAIAITLEVVAWVLTAAQASDVVKIRDSWKSAAPLAAGGLELGRNLLRRENPPWELPANILPPWVAVPPQGCAESAIFAWGQSEESPFTVELK